MSKTDTTKLEKLIADHDLTYCYSDDHSVWMRGERQRNAIQEEAKNHPRSVVVEIWNKHVKRKIVPDAQKQFLWSLKPGDK